MCVNLERFFSESQTSNVSRGLRRAEPFQNCFRCRQSSFLVHRIQALVKVRKELPKRQQIGFDTRKIDVL
ncbi:MAG: hypothetical protein C4293_06345 [Nitrospiraceae bacterium]